jgi:conjugal transfer/entry exclusion protein
MALHTEKLSDELFNKITTLQANLSGIVFDLGQYDIQLKELSDELKIVERMKEIAYDKYKTTTSEFNNLIQDLNKDYPNVELDLEKKLITYEK